jgi:hypothetical protein
MPENSDPEHFAADLLVGAEEIRDHLTALGFEITVDGVYYAKKTQKWAIGKFGGELIASRSKLTRQARNLTA